MTKMLDDLTDLEWWLMERHHVTGFGEIGPLTQEQQENMQAYDDYCEERQREYEAQEAAGGREICPKCGWRTLKSKSVLTYGVPGHAGSEYSAMYECENKQCGYKDLAG